MLKPNLPEVEELFDNHLAKLRNDCAEMTGEEPIIIAVAIFPGLEDICVSSPLSAESTQSLFQVLCQSGKITDE